MRILSGEMDRDDRIRQLKRERSELLRRNANDQYWVENLQHDMAERRNLIKLLNEELSNLEGE